MDGEPLIDSETISEVRSALATFPGLADVAVIEHGAGQAGEYLIRCGADSDFFDLGGRSVEAMVLAGRIGAAFGVRVSMADLFKAPTVADLDRRLDQMADTRN